ncbi:hypothetical protein CKO_03047 [Citrobacter koseri ATCC BAA-895]|uniref:Uncharacterized protein n=1 Tax=Citrobacter koseri (strain ATCC BAA-895 / CDC 4225-83 / SGSC4696) TaxID=290338 RepID=A8AKX4_CITK8|nr:hypothetical protein CKO_03047 [Citrobacter koseri ATCC BAA-895]
MACRAGVYAIGQLTGKFHNQGHCLSPITIFWLQDKRALPHSAM